MIPCIRDIQIKDSYKALYNKHDGRKSAHEIAEEELVNNFLKETWLNLLYDPYIPDSDNKLISGDKVFPVIDNEEDWNKRLDNLNKNNMGLTGLSGLGSGLLFWIMNEELRTTKSAIRTKNIKEQIGN
jgi:hypothetical protein